MKVQMIIPITKGKSPFILPTICPTIHDPRPTNGPKELRPKNGPKELNPKNRPKDLRPKRPSGEYA